MKNYKKVRITNQGDNWITEHRTTGEYINRLHTDDRHFKIEWDKELKPISFEVDDSSSVKNGLDIIKDKSNEEYNRAIRAFNLQEFALKVHLELEKPPKEQEESFFYKFYGMAISKYRAYEGVRRANSFKTSTSTYKINEVVPMNEKTLELVKEYNELMDRAGEIDKQLRSEKF